MLRRSRIYAAILLITWAIWFLEIKYRGLSSWITDISHSNLEKFAQLGDAFGVVGSLMATIAAVGVYQAFSDEKADRKVRDFESKFFTLLQSFDLITSQLSVEFTRKAAGRDFKCSYRPLRKVTERDIIRTFDGRNALTIILFLLRDRVTEDGFRDIKAVGRAYQSIYNNYVGKLGHYFRTLYHIFLFLEEEAPANQAYYARIVRARLSNYELCLLGYNCIVGEGRHKFRRLVEKFAILHNMHRDNLDSVARAELGFMIRKLDNGAFLFEDQVELTYND